MVEFFAISASFILAMTGLGLARLLWGPKSADRLMSAQLLGTGGIASMLLVAAASGTPGVVDLALTLALLAAFVSIAFVKGASENAQGGDAEVKDR
jgi:multicomponent Na+:H+ antiporter subunit F